MVSSVITTYKYPTRSLYRTRYLRFTGRRRTLFHAADLAAAVRGSLEEFAESSCMPSDCFRRPSGDARPSGPAWWRRSISADSATGAPGGSASGSNVLRLLVAGGLALRDPNTCADPMDGLADEVRHRPVLSSGPMRSCFSRGIWVLFWETGFRGSYGGRGAKREANRGVPSWQTAPPRSQRWTKRDERH